MLKDNINCLGANDLVKTLKYFIGSRKFLTAFDGLVVKI